jgi:hypothetical protein
LWQRVVLALGLGVVLVAVRERWIFGDILAARALCVKVVASVLMFRLPLYIYDSISKHKFGLVQTANYFLMFPNACFPLFPVVDYTRFCRGFKERIPSELLHRGLHRVSDGIVQLLLLRFVQTYVFHYPAWDGEVDSALDVVRNVWEPILMYLRLSGSYHLIVGILHLLGYDLPRTHDKYFLASSYLDIWRRMNIYWTHFIQKMIYYPIVMRMKRFTQTTQLFVATAASFVATWILHDYQQYWLNRDFESQTRDKVFWAILGSLVFLTMLWQKRTRKEPRFPLATKVVCIVATQVSFALLWTFWSYPLADWSAQVLGR